MSSCCCALRYETSASISFDGTRIAAIASDLINPKNPIPCCFQLWSRKTTEDEFLDPQTFHILPTFPQNSNVQSWTFLPNSDVIIIAMFSESSLAPLSRSAKCLHSAHFLLFDSKQCKIVGRKTLTLEVTEVESACLGQWCNPSCKVVLFCPPGIACLDFEFELV